MVQGERLHLILGERFLLILGERRETTILKGLPLQGEHLHMPQRERHRLHQGGVRHLPRGGIFTWFGEGVFT